jgi:GNAT superfamily N-acetyltransferase
VDEDALAAASLQSFIGSYRTLIGHVNGGVDRWFGPVYAFTTGSSVSLANGVIVHEPPATADLDAALDWVAAVGAPHILSIPESLADELGSAGDRRGMRRGDWLQPHMALVPVPVPPDPGPDIAVREVTDAASARGFRELLVDGGFPPADAAALFSDAFLGDDDVRAFVADLDGRPAGVAAAIRTDDVAGVYLVGTAPWARRRGVGTAATWAAVGAARDWRSPVVVLQASAMGFGVYEAMGFRTVARFAEFTARRRASEAGS